MMQLDDLLALLCQPLCSALDTAAAVAAHLGGRSSASLSSCCIFYPSKLPKLTAGQPHEL